MTWFAIYETSGGKLRSVGTILPATLPAELTAKDFGLTRPIGVWNPVTLDFDPRPKRRTFPIGRLIRRFTRPERIAFRTSTNQNVKDLWFVMFAEDTIDVDDIAITAGLDFLEVQGIIGPGRADEIRGPFA